MRQISVFAICVLYFILPAFSTLNAEALQIDSKFVGKVGLVVILTGVGAATKLLIHKDHKKLEKIRNKFRLGKPDSIIRIERGFDTWTLEYYGERRYLFKNGTFQRTE